MYGYVYEYGYDGRQEAEQGRSSRRAKRRARLSRSVRRVGPCTYSAKRCTYSYTIWKTASMQLDHERLDVYQVSLDFAAWSYELAKSLKSLDRHLRDQLLRASQSIALNIAEGCGKLPSADRRRFLQIAGGSARECGAILDILVRCQVITDAEGKRGKELLVRIVAMLTRMMGAADHVRESEAVYEYVNGYEYGGDGKAEQSLAPDAQKDARR